MAANWQNPNSTNWQTKDLTDWKLTAAPSWYRMFASAFWDSIRYTWDDLELYWDEVGNDDFCRANNSAWHTK